MRLFLTTIMVAMLSIGSAEAAKVKHGKRHYREHHVSRSYDDGRPAKWCGWFMRTIFGGGPEYNLARNWSKRGSNAGGPRVGAVVVWPHHVGLITGKTNGGWVVKSGNDGGRVRERVRSVSNAIAFRML